MYADASATAQYSAFAEAHGAHVTTGIVWLAVMVAQVGTIGFRPMVVRRLFSFSLFWHAFDIVWIGLYRCLFGSTRMSTEVEIAEADRVPGSHRSSGERLHSYAFGLGLAALLTAASF